MSKFIVTILILGIILSLCSCQSQTSSHKNQNSISSDTISSEESYSGINLQDSSYSSVSEDLADSSSYDEYPYDIDADKKEFKNKKPDIIVGDKLYMTQINDWFKNFETYAGKIVEIEGYYMIFDDKYTFVGRNGPSCPYCTGGYVNFEFKSNDDMSNLVSEKSWIRVTGILREGTMHIGNQEKDEPFYYIETLKLEKLETIGKDTITD